jgi:pimeloyl-ACP methyl ester carboxylesterase
MDLKGSGFSGKPKDGQYAPSDQALLLVKFLRELGQTNIVLVGHSLGGGVALLTYLESTLPNQGITVRGLVLIDSAGYSQNLPFFVLAVKNPVTRFISYLMPPYYRARFVLNRIIKVKEQVTPDRVHRYAYFLNRPGSRYSLHQTAKQIAPQNASELIAKFSTITIPTLIIWGENDPVIPVENARSFNRDIPSSRLVVLTDTGHIPHEERPAQTLEILDGFLESLQ